MTLRLTVLMLALATASPVLSQLSATANTTFLVFQNGRLSFTIDKTTGFLGHVHLDGHDLQGPQSNTSGRGYYECHCVPSSYQVADSDIYHVGTNATFELLRGNDISGQPYVGSFMQEVLPIGHTFQQWFFLRPNETGIHNFARLVYSNSSSGLPFEDGGIPVREIREVFQFNTTLWKTASTNPQLNVSIPSQDAITPAVQVQDATWSLGGTPDEPFVVETSTWWTKYALADAYRYRKAHGLYGVDEDGTAYGAWMVSLTQDTLFGGPTHYDLLLDGMIGVPEGSANLQRIPHIYYYFASSHQGAATSNLTSEGYDRTWGPQILYFNKGSQASLSKLRADAESTSSLDSYADFYNAIAPQIPGFVAPSNRSTFSLSISVPESAEDAVAVLSADGWDSQSNVLDQSTFQYWGEINSNGHVNIPNVRAGTYRLTVYAKGVFGTFIVRNITVSEARPIALSNITWIEENTGVELWRLGTPDRTAGEYRHGFAPVENETYHLMQYRQYWGAYNFTEDFPQGVNFEIGANDVSVDWNYCQFAERNNFTIRFGIDEDQAISLLNTTNAIFTVILAGAVGPTGNEDFSSLAFSDFPLTVQVNNQSLLEWIIPSNVSSSCITRSGISCFVVDHQYVFPSDWLLEGPNLFTLGLSPGSGTRAMYDALRLEVS